MKCSLRKLVACVVVLSAGLGAALAQGQDEYLQRYNLALENLEQSVAALDTDAALSREELDRAAGALRFLARDVAGSSLVNAMDRVFERARVAIQNRSQVDLEVQTAVLRGGFHRLLFESALETAVAGDNNLAAQRLARLADELEFSPDLETQLAAGTASVSEIRLLVEEGVAERLRADLANVDSLLAEGKERAYVALANAYGIVLLVQDSPRTTPQLNQEFVAAISALVADDSENVATHLTTIDGLLAQLADNARAGVNADGATVAEGAPIAPQEGAETAPIEPPAVEAAAEPTTEPTTEPATTATPEATPESPAVAPVEATTVAPVAPTAEPTAEPTAATTNEPAVTPDGNAGISAQAPANNPATTAGEANSQPAAVQAAPSTALDQLLARFGLSERDRSDLARRMAAAGYDQVQDITDHLYAQAGRAVAALEAGDVQRSRDTLRRFQATYRTYLAPLVRTRDSTLDRTTEALTDRLIASVPLQLQDLAVLTAHVGALEQVLSGSRASGAHLAMVSTSLTWSGLVRLIVVILLGLLAFVPLYLLNLAFGGGNRNWQLIGVALFLLLLPVIYEALGFIGSVLADLTGVGVLATLSTYSMFQNPIAQVVWVAVTAIAIGFATAGLYSICVQFGLIGKRAPEIAPAGGPETAAASASDVSAETLVDWDEEF